MWKGIMYYWSSIFAWRIIIGFWLIRTNIRLFIYKKLRWEKCCIEQQQVHIHGGGQAISEPNNQNGSSRTSKVCFFLYTSPFFEILDYLTFLRNIWSNCQINK